MISYEPLFIQLIKNNMTKTQLREAVGFSTVSLARMSKNQYVSMETINNICKYLKCNVEDVIKYIE